MKQPFKTSRRVEFRDTDMAGIVHFSNFFLYMEQAEHELLRSIGLGVFWEFDGQLISWPRVNAQCNYRNALRFDETVEISVSVQRIGSKSVTFGFEFHRGDAPIADGIMTAACCLIKHGVPPESVAIPEEFIEAIKPFQVVKG